jgi:hypothetical protein
MAANNPFNQVKSSFLESFGMGEPKLEGRPTRAVYDSSFSHSAPHGPKMRQLLPIPTTMTMTMIRTTSLAAWPNGWNPSSAS